MKTNEGTIDRVIRVILGLGVLFLAFIGPKSPWAYIGIVPIVTGFVGFCPAYALLGIKTCPLNKDTQKDN